MVYIYRFAMCAYRLTTDRFTAHLYRSALLCLRRNNLTDFYLGVNFSRHVRVTELEAANRHIELCMNTNTQSNIMKLIFPFEHRRE